MTIRSFHGPHRFLSNFYGQGAGDVRLAIVFEGVTYPTVEHAYQAAKLVDRELRLVLRDLPTPGEAKRFPAECGGAIRVDWDEVKLDIMDELVRQKFLVPELAALLLATGTEKLVEGNHWNDTFYGVDSITGEGQNHLGRILMKHRARSRKA